MTEVHLVVGYDYEGAYAFAAFSAKETAEKIRDAANEYTRQHSVLDLEGSVFKEDETELYQANLAKWEKAHPLSSYVPEERSTALSMYAKFAVSSLPVHTL